MMRKFSLFLVVAVALSCNVVIAEALITYRSFDDLTPSDAGIVLGEPGSGSDSATIEIWFTPTDGQPTTLAAGGFVFAGTVDEGGIIISEDGGISSSEHQWAGAFQVAAQWFAQDTLPNPLIVAAFGSEAVPVQGLLLGTLTVTANEVGTWTQSTNPLPFREGNLANIPLETGSDFYSVTVLPEPTTAALAVIGAMLVCGRRSKYRCGD